MLTAYEQMVYTSLFAASASLSGIFLGFLAILFSIYSAYADRVERPPILNTVRSLAIGGLTLLAYNSAISLGVFLAILFEVKGLLILLGSAFGVQVVAIPLFAAFAGWKILR